MVHLEQAQPEQLQELWAFAEEAFRTPEGKVDFPTLLPKLYGPVSYTHLDVYKRQVRHRAHRRKPCARQL